MFRRRLLLFLALPVVLGLLMAAWDGLQTAAFLHLAAASGMSVSSVGIWGAASALGQTAGLAIGGLFAAIVAPEVAAAIGAIAFAGGLLGFALAPGAAAPVCLVAAAFTGGLPLPGVFAAAARAFPRPAHQLRNALFFVLVATMGAGAAGGSAAMGAAYGVAGAVPALGALAAPALLAALLAAATAIGGRMLAPYPAPEPGRRLPWVALGVSAGSFLLAALPWGLASAASAGLRLGLMQRLGPGVARMMWMDPFVACAGGVVGAVTCGVAYALKRDLPTLLWVGGGFVVIAVGAAGGAVGLHGSTTAMLAANLLQRSGEALVLAPLLSRITGDVHWRLSGPLAAAWLALDTLSLTAGYPLATYLSAHPDLPQLAVVGLAGTTGLVLLLAAIPVQRLLARADAPVAA